MTYKWANELSPFFIWYESLRKINKIAYEYQEDIALLVAHFMTIIKNLCNFTQMEILLRGIFQFIINYLLRGIEEIVIKVLIMEVEVFVAIFSDIINTRQEEQRYPIDKSWRKPKAEEEWNKS